MLRCVRDEVSARIIRAKCTLFFLSNAPLIYSLVAQTREHTVERIVWYDMMQGCDQAEKRSESARMVGFGFSFDFTWRKRITSRVGFLVL